MLYIVLLGVILWNTWVFNWSKCWRSGLISKVRIVTDSTNDLPAELVDEYDINVIPMYVNFGERSFQDGIDITRQDFYTQLPESDPFPTTAAPGIDQFTAVYEELMAAGADEILSIRYLNLP